MAIAEHAVREPITINFGSNVTPQLNALGLQRRDNGSESLWQSLVSRPDIPDEVLRELLDVGLFIDELGHRAGPKWLLEKLADQFKYPEAILTLVKVAYTNREESPEQFELMLSRFGKNCPWIMESLAYAVPSCPDKRIAYIGHLGADQDDLRRISEMTEAEARAKKTIDLAEIERLFAIQEPRVLRALADNPSTPDNLLKILITHRGQPLSRVIRSLASSNLQSRRHGTN
jgi:hypothetical protein